MAEALFYHLTDSPLEAVLPGLLERSLARGWRATVRVGTPERVEALDRLLWTYRDDSFLPHGADSENAARHPVFLTASDDTPNAPDALFLVDRADAERFDAHARTIVLFDGADEEAVAFARTQWLRAKAQARATYWRQKPGGGWEKAAEAAAPAAQDPAPNAP